MRSPIGSRRRFAIAAAIVTSALATLASPAGASPLSGSPVSAITEVPPIRAATATQPAVRLAVPSVAVGLPPVPVNRSTCRDDLAGPSMTIVIPDISYVCPVYSGSQDVLDAGAVAALSHPGVGSLLASRPGQSGTLWIAAHRTSHGGTFAAIPDLSVGAVVTVSDDSGNASYRVVARTLVQVRNDLVVDATGRATEAATLEAVLRPDLGISGAPRLLLQTCEGATMRWMIYADLIPG